MEREVILKVTHQIGDVQHHHFTGDQVPERVCVVKETYEKQPGTSTEILYREAKVDLEKRDDGGWWYTVSAPEKKFAACCGALTKPEVALAAAIILIDVVFDNINF